MPTTFSFFLYLGMARRGSEKNAGEMHGNAWRCVFANEREKVVLTGDAVLKGGGGERDEKLDWKKRRKEYDLVSLCMYYTTSIEPYW
jgi:hypothetical protein